MQAVTQLSKSKWAIRETAIILTESVCFALGELLFFGAILTVSPVATRLWDLATASRIDRQWG